MPELVADPEIIEAAGLRWIHIESPRSADRDWLAMNDAASRMVSLLRSPERARRRHLDFRQAGREPSGSWVLFVAGLLLNQAK